HKQREVVLKYFQLKASTKKPISVKQLSETAETSASIIKSLIDKEIFEEYYLQTDRTDFLAENLQKEIILSEAQNKALEEIKQRFIFNLSKNICKKEDRFYIFCLKLHSRLNWFRDFANTLEMK